MISSSSEINTLESIAQTACFETNYQKKSEAQKYFLEACKQLTPAGFTQILNEGSETLIFVVVEYVNKMLSSFTVDQSKELFHALEQVMLSWYSQELNTFFKRSSNQQGQIARQNGTHLQNNNINQGTNQNQILGESQIKELTKYIQNSLVLLLSNFLKVFFSQDEVTKRSEIVHKIQSTSNPKWKLFLYKAFIDNVSQIDTSMGFLKFRSLSYSFQEQVVPLIAKCIMPYLYSVEDIMKINEISQMQENLNFEDSGTVNGQHYSRNNKAGLFLNQSEFRFAQLVFGLLHSLVFYNFHLTYTEYEQEANFQNCLICFPEEFTSNVITEDFLSSLGYVIERLIQLIPNSKFLQITLECLQKIFLTKLSYINQEKKISFVKSASKMMTKVIKKATSSVPNLTNGNSATKGHIKLLTKLIVCNNKFITNVEINYFKDKTELKESFQEWLLVISNIIVESVNSMDFSEQFNFNAENSLIVEALELYSKVVSSVFSSSFYSSTFEEQSSHESEQKLFITQTVRKIVEAMMNKLFSPPPNSIPLLTQSIAQIFKTNILQIKVFCSSFFQPFKQLASIQYGFFFELAKQKIDFCLSSNESSPSVKFTAFIMLTEMIERNYLQRNIIMEKASDAQIKSLAGCVSSAFKFLSFYMDSRSTTMTETYSKNREMDQIILMDMSVLIFLDKVLCQFLSQFESSQNSLEIKHKIFVTILTLQKSSHMAAKMSQQILSEGIKYVLKFLLIYNNNSINESKHVNHFIFETINRLLMKFKWGSKREVFKNSEIYQVLANFFNSILEETKIPNQQGNGSMSNAIEIFQKFQRLKWRKKLLKMVALLYFDDVIDDYRTNLENIFDSLKTQHILTVLLDLQGISQAIDASVIYKSFIQMTERYCQIEQLTIQVVKFSMNFRDDEIDPKTKKYPKIKIIKQVLKLHYAILSNKGQRMSNANNLFQMYKLIHVLIDYWTNFIKMCCGDEWLPILRQVVQIVTQLIRCDRISFYLIQRTVPQKYLNFMSCLFHSLQSISEQIEECPKIHLQTLSLMCNMSRQILDPIFFPCQRLRSFANTNNIQSSQKNSPNFIAQNYIKLVLSIFKKMGPLMQEIKSGSTKNETYLQKSLDIVKFTLSYINSKVRRYKPSSSQITGNEESMQYLQSYIELIRPYIFEYQSLILQYLMTQKHFSVHKRIMITIIYEGSTLYQSNPLMGHLLGGLNLPTHLIEQLKQSIQFLEKQEQQMFIDRFKTWLRMLNMTEGEFQKHKKENQNGDFFGFMGIL